MKTLYHFILLTAVLTQCSKPDDSQHPNILWITCEDISPYLGCYGCREAYTPNLDQLAEEGIRYTRAYANAPVCAVARSALLTGMYSTSIGTHNMRCHTLLPESVPAYPRIFRDAGYYCTNNHKKDYNSNYNQDTTLWDESSPEAHYRNREEGQPFFAVFNIFVSHESQLSAEEQSRYMEENLIPEKPRVDPDSMVLPPYHPDLPEIRWDWARFHDMITLMDKIAGERLRELDASGEAGNTIVFFYSDHGGMLARSKRYIYNVGTQVPLIIRFPEKWQSMAPGKPGSREERLVSFTDLPKTVLSITGLDVPDQMQGRIFLGPDREPAPDALFFSRDRMAERFDFSRAVTDGRFYYIRNFTPHRPRGRDTRYGFQVQANWRAWENHFESGLCNDVQSQFFRPKPVVQLFDTREDPWHVHNLADDEAYGQLRKGLSAELDRWMIETRDLGLVPEPLYGEIAGPAEVHRTLYDYGQSDDFQPERLLQVAKSASQGDPGKLSDYLGYMQDREAAVRYWGAYGLFLIQKDTVTVREALEEMIHRDPYPANRVMAAQALAFSGDPEQGFETIYEIALETESPTVFLQALNAFQYSHTDNRLTLKEWKLFEQKQIEPVPGRDMSNMGYAGRIIADAIGLWPERREAD